MTILIPASGERFEAQLVADDRGVLHLLQVRPRVDYLLAAVLKIGWRIVDSTPDERAPGGAWVRERVDGGDGQVFLAAEGSCPGLGTLQTWPQVQQRMYTT